MGPVARNWNTRATDALERFPMVLTDADKAFRDDVRRFLQEALTDELRRAGRAG